MKMLKFLTLCLTFALFVGCAATKSTDNDTTVSYIGNLPMTFNLPVKKMIPIHYEGSLQKHVCGISDFYTEYRGKKIPINGKNIRIDEVIVTMIVQKEQKSLENNALFDVFDNNSKSATAGYRCTYTGYGVELDFSNVEYFEKGLSNATKVKKSPKKKQIKEDEEEDDEDEDDEE